VTHPGANGELIKGIYRRAEVKAANSVVVHSEAVASILASWQIEASKIRVMPLVHYCFDYNLYQELRDNLEDSLAYEDAVLLFGRLEEYKGVWEFIDAARLLSTADTPEITMIVAGTGRLSEELGKCEKPNNLEMRNYLIKDAEVIDLLSQAGLVVLPYSEASQSALIPLAYLFHKPVLVTQVGALPEYVQDNVTGRVIDSNEPSILAATILDLLREKETLKAMGKAGRDFLDELESQLLKGLVDTYRTVAQERTHNPEPVPDGP
jgi:glycosyltransferase involved in cell wall biosynthesis